MIDLSSQARSAFLAGIAHFEAGRLEPAEQAFRAALALAPGRPSVQCNLGLTLMHQSRWAEAEPLLRAGTAGGASERDWLRLLGECRVRLQDWAGAVEAFSAAGSPAELGPQAANGWAYALMASGQPLAALSVLEPALQAASHSAQLHLLMGDLLRSLDRRDEASHHYRQAGTLGAEPDLVAFYLAGLDGSDSVAQAPRGYVAGLFDDYAPDFERHLLDTLGYVGHRTLVQGLPPAPLGGWGRALDLGCGTGLCGELLRPQCRELEGLDLAPRMIEQAARRGVYDRLHTADAIDFLAADGLRYDLVVAADVLIYIGALDRMLPALARRLRPGGVFAASVETCDGDGVRLTPDLRFQHPRAYLERMAASAGLRWLDLRQGPVRAEQARPVDGAFVYLQRAP